MLVWIAYCLFCIPTYDFLPSIGGPVNFIGWVVAAVLSGFLRKREAIRTGIYDRQAITRATLHWFGGVALLIVALLGLTYTNPHISPIACGQISVMIVGILYFTAGVHMPEAKFMLWAGPLIVLTGIALAYVPHYRWTVVGVIFAVCLTLPLIFSRRGTPATEANL
jgi:hypothetical protein